MIVQYGGDKSGCNTETSWKQKENTQKDMYGNIRFRSGMQLGGRITDPNIRIQLMTQQLVAHHLA